MPCRCSGVLCAFALCLAGASQAATCFPERGATVPSGSIGHHPAIFEHRPVGTAPHIAYVHGTLAP